jgi:hypothetical protein
MRLLSIGVFMLILASAASLVSGDRSKQFIGQSWSQAWRVLPTDEMQRVASMIPASTERVFLLIPVALREKFAGKVWNAVELMIFRVLLAWHLLPAVVMAGLIGFTEGHWARANQKGLVKIHSPMRFNLALGALAVIPVLVLLWVTAPLIVSVRVPLSSALVLAIFGLRNVIVHAPTQF